MALLRVSTLSAFIVSFGWTVPLAAQGVVQGTATAEVISLAEISAQQATALLFSPTPGILRVSIPGGTAPLDLQASAVEGGTFTFTADSSSSAAMTEVVQALESGKATGSLSTPLSLSGFINGRGVQIVVLSAAQAGDGSGSLKATITFD